MSVYSIFFCTVLLKYTLCGLLAGMPEKNRLEQINRAVCLDINANCTELVKTVLHRLP